MNSFQRSPLQVPYTRFDLVWGLYTRTSTAFEGVTMSIRTCSLLAHLVLILAISPTLASADWVSFFGVKFCSSDGMKREDTKWVEQTAGSLNGRKFEFTHAVYEDNSRRMDYTLEDYQSLYPAEQTSNGEQIVTPYTIEFATGEKVRLNEKWDVNYELVGCDGGNLTVDNVVNQQDHSRFSGAVEVVGSSLQFCSGSCNGTLKAGEFKTTLYYREVR